MSTPFDLKRLRGEFPILSTRINGQPLVYLDNAATTQKPRLVIDAISQYYKRYNANVHRAAHTLSGQATEAFEQIRHTLAAFIGAPHAREIIWTRGTTESLNLVAYSFLEPRLQTGDRVLLMDVNHHANIVPWQQTCLRRGAHIDVLNAAIGEIDWQQYRELLARKPVLVALTQVSNATGARYPIHQLCREAKSAGAVVVVDGAQAVPHDELDLSKLACDFYAFSGHKLFGPTGIGALWGRQSLLSEMTPWQTGGEMIESVSFETTRFAGLPFKFEAGTPDIAGVIGLGAAIDFLTGKNRQALAAHETALRQQAMERCQSIKGWRAVAAGDNPASLISFVIDGHHPQDIGLWLDQQGIAVRAGHHCAMPLMSRLGLNGTVRASLAFYNTAQEVERFAQALETLVNTGTTAPVSLELTSQNIALIRAVEQASDWHQRYGALMKLGSMTPRLPATLQQDKFRVHGCESKVWLIMKLDSEGRLDCHADADARILRALLALLLHWCNGLMPQEVLLLDLRARIAELDLSRHLSPSRGNGVIALIEALEQFAQTCAEDC